MTKFERDPLKIPLYLIEVNLDWNRASDSERETYKEVVDKYGAIPIYHDDTKTFTIFISSEREIDPDQLKEDLGEIEIKEDIKRL